MEPKPEYKIVTATDLGLLEDEVVELIADGWQPIAGAVYGAIWQDKEYADKPVNGWAQTMYKLPPVIEEAPPTKEEQVVEALNNFAESEGIEAPFKNLGSVVSEKPIL